MGEIFSDEWLSGWAELINSDGDIAARAPEGLWRVHVVVNGDDSSPYVAESETLQLMLHLEDGRCTRLERVDSPPGPRDLDFRFAGPATVFEKIAAGQLDPVDAGLEGQIAIAGDMRFLLRYAELVTEVMDLFMSKLETEWPRGKPPYEQAAPEEAS